MIRNYCKNYSLLTSSLKDQKLISVAPVKALETNTAFTKYIEGRSLERDIIDLFLQGEIESVVIRINKYIEIIRSLASLPQTLRAEEVNPDIIEGLKNSLIDFDKYGAQEYISFAPIDINFDNIIIDPDNQWWLIDYEWVFDLKIPRSLLISRAILHLLQRYSYVFSRHSRKIKLLQLAPTIIIPELVYQEFKQFCNYFDLVQKFENILQEYITGSPQIIKLNMYDKPRLVGSPSSLVSDYGVLLKEADELRAMHDILLQDAVRLHDELNGVYSSRTYKLAQQIRKMIKGN